MELLLQLVNFFKKLNVLLHDPSVFSLLSLLVLTEALTQVFKVLLEVVTLGYRCRLFVVLILIFRTLFILNIDLVQLNDTFLELLVICDFLKAFENVVFEAFNIAILRDDCLTNVFGLFG